MKRSFPLIVIIFSSVLTYSQTIQDAVRYSFLTSSSTSRAIGVGGSMSPVGADISVANINPAGVAEFKKSEFVISFGLPINETTSSIDGGINETEKVTNFKLNSLGAVFSHKPRSIKMKTSNISIGINKLADFNQNIFYAGTTPGTRVERFLEQANLRNLEELDDFEAGVAFDSQLILDEDGDTNYESDFVTYNEELYKEENIERSGYLNELFFNYAANYNNKISFGFTLGIPILEFSERKDYLEADNQFIINSFLDYIYSQELKTSGGGINAKIGVIIKPIQKLRISAAIHSPTWYYLSDEFSTALDFRLDGEETGLVAESPISSFDYQLRTPWRAFAGVGLIYSLGDLKGFVNAEIEYIDYTSSSFNLTSGEGNSGNQFFEEDLNIEISEDLTTAMNYRLGTEIAFQKFRFRTGASVLSSPYNNTYENNIDPQFNFGIGWRGNRTYLDISYSQANSSEEYTPYRLLNEMYNQEVNIKNSLSRIGLTIGFKL